MIRRLALLASALLALPASSVPLGDRGEDASLVVARIADSEAVEFQCPDDEICMSAPAIIRFVNVRTISGRAIPIEFRTELTLHGTLLQGQAVVMVVKRKGRSEIDVLDFDYMANSSQACVDEDWFKKHRLSKPAGAFEKPLGDICFPVTLPPPHW